MPRHEPTPSGLTLTALLILLPLPAGFVIASINTNQQARASNKEPFLTPVAELPVGRCPIELANDPDTTHLLRYFEACQTKTIDPEPIRWVRPAALTDHCLDRSSPPSAPQEAFRTQGWTAAILMSGPCAPPDQFLQDTSLGVPAFFFPPNTPLSDLQKAFSEDVRATIYDPELKILTIEEQIEERRQQNLSPFWPPSYFDSHRLRPITPRLWLL